MIKYAILSILSLGLFSCQSTEYSQSKKLAVIDSTAIENVVVAYEKYDLGGNTSVDNDQKYSYRWSGEPKENSTKFGYFINDSTEIPYMRRRRDLGQTFTYDQEEKKVLSGLIIRTGYGSNVVRSEVYGAAVSVQFFEVTGDAVINDNGSSGDIKAFHGFPSDRHTREIPAIRDDYITGETYKSLKVFSGYNFPAKREFGFENDTITISPANPQVKGRLLHFTFPKEQSIILEPGKRYGFLIMLDKSKKGHGFTLANNFIGSYEGGHGIRREGNGVFPPPPAHPDKPFDAPENIKALKASKLPENWEERLAISPGTDGYPDVDTWRDLNFYIEAVSIK
ncbi:hypothetical protein [Aquimarina celericrescens]|uniref:DUF4861 domain-containing protein n=1 Tax=Aquimarina celericrescens TaxID=1964542 RepID=A0ABW5B2W5_9FLAO|nr:hypothetical protein [Aquimarina celericrescens]